MLGSTMTSDELRYLVDLLEALNRGSGIGFLPIGYNGPDEDGSAPPKIPALTFWDADLLIGRIVYDRVAGKFFYQQVSEDSGREPGND